MNDIKTNNSSDQIGLIPESELILHTEPYKSRLSQAITWAEQNPAQASDLKSPTATLEPTKILRKRASSSTPN
jgi:hypothetical protein